MIDWITFAVHGVLHRPYVGNMLAETDTDTGADLWRMRKSRALHGSASDRVMVKSGDIDQSGMASTLRVSGNPSKMLQGHNLYGSDDLPALVYELAARAMVAGLALHASARLAQPDPCEQAATLHALARAVAARPRPHETVRAASRSWKGATDAPVPVLPGQATHDCDSPHVTLSRVDVNYMADLGSDHDVRLWIAAARRCATFANRPARGDDDTTVYFASSASQRARLKFYSKGPEFAAHPPRALRNLADDQQPLAFRERGTLEQHAAGKLRAELGLHIKALVELGLRYASAWNSLTARRTWLATLEKFDMPQPSDTLDTSALPTRLALALHAWKGGEDLRARYSRPTWYRVRNELRTLAGIDIASPCTDPRPLNLPALGPPLRAWPCNVVEMFPADDEPAPAALVAAGLYFEPRTDWRIEHRPAPHLPPPYRPAFCPWPRDPADRREVA